MINLIGKKFNRLTIKEYYPGFKSKWRKHPAFVLCICDCGNEKIIRKAVVTLGMTKSCGCLVLEACIKRSTKHGHSKRGGKTREYGSWRNMIVRCYDKNNKDYPRYHKKGIVVCDRWRNSFENFIEDMGLKPKGLNSLDRIDNNGNYEPGNCRWTDQKTQVWNSTVIKEKTKIICAQCSKEIIVPPCFSKTRKYCSYKCKYKGPKIEKNTA